MTLFLWNTSKYHVDEDAEFIPPTQPSGCLGWYAFDSRPNKLILIETYSVDQAKNLAYDEFGVSDFNSFSIEIFTSLEKMLEGLKIREEDFKRSKVPIWSRTKDRKILRSDLDGMVCNSCGSFYLMAVANLPGGKLKCFSCKSR